MKESGRKMTDEVAMRKRDVQKQERRDFIEEYNYSVAYELVITEGLLLKRRGNEKERKRERYYWKVTEEDYTR